MEGLNVEERLEDGEALLKCFSPLFNSMRLLGLYFTRETGRIHDVSSSTSVTKQLETPTKWNRGRIYAVVIMVVAWLNMARMMTAFHESDQFGVDFLLKLPMFNCGVSTAVLLASCFVACHTGNLDRIFRDARLWLSNSDVTRYRRLAVIHVIVCWGVLMIELPLYLVPTFALKTGLSVGMAPFGVYVSASHHLLIVAEVMTTVVFILAAFTWLMSHSVNYICYSNFSKVLHV